MAKRPLIAGIDAGGTTFKLGVADADGTLLATSRVRTTQPEETIAKAADELSRLANEAGGEIERFGVASFGPVDIDPRSTAYGTLLSTPKAGWSGARILGLLQDQIGAPGTLDTDVNAALEAEMADGAGRGAASAAYVTVGTGIGVGIKSRGGFAAFPRHPELGHIRVARHRGDAGFGGVCPFHGDCLEGLAAGPALSERFGPLEGLGQDAPAWDLAGHYLAQLSLTLVLGFRVDRIVFGGGVLNAEPVMGAIAEHYDRLMAGYVTDVAASSLLRKAEKGDLAGTHGALAIARRQRVDG